MNFLNSGRAVAALVFYLPGVCTHTDTDRKRRKARVRNILKSSTKNTIYNEHPVAGLFLDDHSPARGARDNMKNFIQK